MYILSRREFFALAAAAAAGVCGSGKALASMKQPGAQAGITADQALGELLAGDKRFASGTTSAPPRQPKHFPFLTRAPHPEALLLACADSRGGAEILFRVVIRAHLAGMRAG